MAPLVLGKPVFKKDQVLSATEASESLSTIRKCPKWALQYLRELEIDRIAVDRIKNGPHEFIPFEDALTPEELAEFESMDHDAIFDEDLFE